MVGIMPKSAIQGMPRMVELFFRLGTVSPGRKMPSTDGGRYTTLANSPRAVHPLCELLYGLLSSGFSNEQPLSLVISLAGFLGRLSARLCSFL
jgi:hypothetical protein